MQKNKTSLAGYLFRWLMATAFIATVAIAVIHFKPQLSQIKEQQTPREGRRALTPAQLIAGVDERLELERAHCTALEQSLAEARESYESIGTPVMFTSEEVDERRRELIRYADFVNSNEGVILENGAYISATELRDRAVHRRAELAAITKQIEDAKEFAIKTTGTVRELERILNQRKRTVVELDLLRTNLVEKVNLLATMTASSDVNPHKPSLLSLRETVARMQDVIEVRLDMAKEDAANEVYVVQSQYASSE